ncbi:MAG: uracil-DNA glycosylase, partial [Longimicrobiales bacterium]
MKVCAPLPPLPPSWRELEPATRTPGFEALRRFLNEDSQHHTIYPPLPDVYHALEVTPLDRVRVLLLGQDPYHGAGMAHGLAFSVRHGVKIPASLRNIHKELSSDVGIAAPPH